MSKPIQVGIVGPSGSGKTWLARRLASALAATAVYINLDDFYRDLSALPPEKRSEVNFDDPAAIDWDCVHAVVDAFSSGKVACVPVYDFATHTRTARSRQVEPKEFVFWDGLWLLHQPWSRERFAFSVFVDCPTLERLARRITRDVLERGRTPESVCRQFEQQVEPMREKFVEPQRQWAMRHITSPVGEEGFQELLALIVALKEGDFCSQS